jgi:3-O-methylgallate 3,4-dioxygenase
MITTPPELWAEAGERNKLSKELLSHKHDGSVVPYETLLQEANGRFDSMVGLERFKENYDRLQVGVAELNKTMKEVKPDVVVVVSDDQDEILFDDNMPMFCVYWGDTYRQSASKAADGKSSDREMDIPVDSALGKHLIEHLVDHEFDVSHMRYMKEEYGGSIGPAGYVWWKRETAPPPGAWATASPSWSIS